MANYYWKNITNNRKWDEPKNWFSDPFGKKQATEIPPTDDGENHHFGVVKGETSTPFPPGIAVKTITREDKIVLAPYAGAPDGRRRLSAVFAPNAEKTLNSISLGGHKILLYSLGKGRLTVPVYIDVNATQGNKSCMIDGKIYDTDLSGPKHACALNVEITGRNAIPVKNHDLSGVPILCNQFDDIIFATPRNSGIISKETTAYWLGQSMRLVFVDTYWMIAVSLHLTI
jgi:hypothetical protein